MTTLHTVLPPASDAKFIGDEPTWTDVQVPEEKYNSEIVQGLNWHNYCASDKDYIKYMEQYLREHRPHSAKQDIQAWRNLGSVNKTICALARMYMQGFPLRSNDSQKIRDYVMSFANVKKQAKVSSTTPVKTNKPNIQDRIRAQVSTVLAELDGKMDEAFEGDIPTSDVLTGDILSKGFKAPQLKLVQQYLRKHIAEWYAAYNGEDEQLVEGYAYVGKRNFKKIIDAFSTAMDNISQQQTKVKSLRIRKKKPMDKKKMASKIRFKAEHEGIKSCNPVDIIGANMVWVYDTKKRRLGYYEAEVKDSLYVKGPKIYGFKVTCEKILRKPEEQLAEVMKLRKNQTVNWFDGIKAKCKTMTGRTTTDLLIVRID